MKDQKLPFFPKFLGVLVFRTMFEGKYPNIVEFITFQGWFHGHGVYTTIDGMKYEGKIANGHSFFIQVYL